MSTDLIVKNDCENRYLILLKSIVEDGKVKISRNGRILYKQAQTLDFDLQYGFPLLTTKKMFFRGIVAELFMFLRGETDTTVLEKSGIRIWSGNTSEKFIKDSKLNLEPGSMGPMYGYQWRNFGGSGFDQLKKCMDQIKNKPESRDILMTSFNPVDAEKGVLRPCHGIGIMFDVEETGKIGSKKLYKLNCTMMQRSGDMFLGIPFNIASYALLLHLMTTCINSDPEYKNRIVPGLLSIVIHNAHIYENHIEPSIIQFCRVPSQFPELSVTNPESVLDPAFLSEKNVILKNYISQSGIKADMVA